MPHRAVVLTRLISRVIRQGGLSYCSAVQLPCLPKAFIINFSLPEKKIAALRKFCETKSCPRMTLICFVKALLELVYSAQRFEFQLLANQDAHFFHVSWSCYPKLFSFFCFEMNQRLCGEWNIYMLLTEVIVPPTQLLSSHQATRLTSFSSFFFLFILRVKLCLCSDVFPQTVFIACDPTGPAAHWCGALTDSRSSSSSFCPSSFASRVCRLQAANSARLCGVREWGHRRPRSCAHQQCTSRLHVGRMISPSLAMLSRL